MPSKSKEQHDLMAAVANDPDFARKVGIPVEVGKEYAQADKKQGKYTKKRKGKSDGKRAY